MDTTKVNTIHQIVRLRQMLRKWQKLAAVEKRLTTLGSVLSPRRCRSTFSYSSDDESSQKPPAVPPDVPEGFLAVYVGKERRRFIVRTNYLNHPLFRALLQKAEEEFGFVHHGGVTIPCEAVFFEHLLWLLDKNDVRVQRSELQELLDFYSTDMHECCTEASLMKAHFLTSERSSLIHASAQESSG